jgi:NAD(P)-dependent dehydrogenase (short-subunit alcohol dehydrogenase family)
VQADITNLQAVTAMFLGVKERFDHLDYLVLNASGGLEKDKPQDYSMLLNCSSQLHLAEAALP